MPIVECWVLGNADLSPGLLLGRLTICREDKPLSRTCERNQGSAVGRKAVLAWVQDRWVWEKTTGQF